MKTKFYLKPSVLGAAVAAAVAVAGSPAYALDAKISGQVNRALMNVDDGHASETYNVDNDNSSTRFRFTGSEDIGSGLKAGIVWEVEYQSNPSDVVNQNDKSVSGGGAGASPDLDERIMEVYLEGAFGKAGLGQGDGAMNGGVEVDLSGTSVISYAGTGDIGGGILFRNSANGALTANTIRNRLNQQDFESRYDRLRYDSPALGPITLSASTGQSSNDDVVEYGARVNTNIGGGGKLAAALGISTNKDNGSPLETETVGGSVSLLLPGGLNFTLATSTKEKDPGTPGSKTTEGDFTYFKVGYKTGQHAVSLDIAMGDDQDRVPGVGDGELIKAEAEHTGIQYVWSPKNWAELYAGYKTVSFDDNTATNYDDLDFITIGMRLKF